jgi:hypothetical protein
MSGTLPEIPRIDEDERRVSCAGVGFAFGGSVSLTLLAGAAVFVLLPAAHAGRPENHSRVSTPVAAAGRQTLELIHDQTLAVERNTRYLEQRERFSEMLLQLKQKTPTSPQQAAQIDRAIRTDQRALTQAERNILLSRLHLLATLPGKVGRVYYLLYKMGKVGPDDLRVAAFIAFAARRQQSVLDQLIKILNQEQASTILPGT